MDQVPEIFQAHAKALMQSGDSVPLSQVYSAFQQLLTSEDFWVHDCPEEKFKFDIGNHVTFDLKKFSGRVIENKNIKVLSDVLEIELKVHATSSSSTAGTRFQVENLSLTSRVSLSSNMAHAALLGFNTFWTFSAGNPFTGGIYAPENAEFQHLWSSAVETNL